MIKLSWLQFRTQAVTAAAALAAFAVLLAVTGPHLASQYAASGLGSCHGGNCGSVANTFLSQLQATSTYPVVYLLGIALILFAPAIIGIFWGAPLIAREVETRTSVLAWTQSISRTRWLAVKLGLTGLPAMAVTLVIFAAAQVAMPLWVRPHLIPPDRTIAAIGPVPGDNQAVGLDYGNLTAVAVPGQPGAWIISSGAINPAGQQVTTLPATCAGAAGAKADNPGQCLNSQGYREAISYEPASRYWPLQWIETGIFLGLALGLAGCCFWRLNRRRS